jgi:hypothetical protein
MPCIQEYWGAKFGDLKLQSSIETTFDCFNIMVLASLYYF